jgi:hypothetical protein
VSYRAPLPTMIRCFAAVPERASTRARSALASIQPGEEVRRSGAGNGGQPVASLARCEEVERPPKGPARSPLSLDHRECFGVSFLGFR